MWKFNNPFARKAGHRPVAAALEAAGKEGVKKSSEKVTDLLVGSLVGAVLPAAIGGAVAAVSAGAVSKLVESLLKQADDTRHLVESLTTEPYKTGTRIVRESLLLPASTTEQVHYRNTRLTSGVLKLEEARTLVSDADSKMVVLALLGLAELVIPGGAQASHTRFIELASICRSEISVAKTKLEAIAAVDKPDAAVWSDRQQRYNRAIEDGSFADVKGPLISPSGARREAELAYKRYAEAALPHEVDLQGLTLIATFAERMAEQALLLSR
jgi:hypothetical protein